MKEKSRGSLLFSNIFVYGLNQVLVVLIPMIMLPIYSRLLPDISVYGISSLATTICTLASTLATFGLFDAAVRFAFDETSNKEILHQEICSTATAFLFCTSISISAILILFRKAVSVAFYGTDQYDYIVVITAGMTLFTVWNTASLIPIRIYNKKGFAIANSLIKAIITAVATIILIYLKEYVISIPFGTMIALAITWLITFLVIQRKFLRIKFVRLRKMKEMLKYAAPLMLTFVSYWIYQSADKIMLSKLSTMTQVGIYAIGSKVSAVSAVIQNAFASGWAYFAFSTMKDKDQIELISKIFRAGIAICCFFSGIVMIFIHPVFNLVFARGDYLQGANLCAALFTAPLFLTLMQIIGTQLLIQKNTKVYSGVQIAGAIINVVLNFIFIPLFGSRGAAVATLMGYAVPLIILICILVKRKKLYVSINYIFQFAITFVSLLGTTLFVNDLKLSYLIGLVNIFSIFVLCRHDLIKGVLVGKRYIIQRRSKNDNA